MFLLYGAVLVRESYIATGNRRADKELQSYQKEQEERLELLEVSQSHDYNDSH